MLPAGARGRYLPFPNVIRPGEKVTSPVIEMAVLLYAVQRSSADAPHTDALANTAIDASAGKTTRTVIFRPPGAIVLENACVRGSGEEGFVPRCLNYTRELIQGVFLMVDNLQPPTNTP